MRSEWLPGRKYREIGRKQGDVPPRLVQPRSSPVAADNSRPSAGECRRGAESRSARHQDAGFVVRALDDGGPVFEDDRSNTLAEAMAALEEGWPSGSRKRELNLNSGA